MLLVAVPGHHVFNHLQAFQNRVSFRFILKLLVRGMHLRDELVWRRLLGYPDHRSGEKRIHSSYPDCFWLKVTGMRAAIYARISTHDGWQDAQRQLPQLGPLAATQGWEICGDYIHHESGGHFERVEFRLVGCEVPREWNNRCRLAKSWGWHIKSRRRWSTGTNQASFVIPRDLKPANSKSPGWCDQIRIL